jgi:hypothetical protein
MNVNLGPFPYIQFNTQTRACIVSLLNISTKTGNPVRLWHLSHSHSLTLSLSHSLPLPPEKAPPLSLPLSLSPSPDLLHQPWWQSWTPLWCFKSDQGPMLCHWSPSSFLHLHPHPPFGTSWHLTRAERPLYLTNVSSLFEPRICLDFP